MLFASNTVWLPQDNDRVLYVSPHWWTPKPYDLKTASIASDGESLLYASEKSVCSLKGREKPYPRKTQNRDVGPYKDLDGFVSAACAPIKLCLAAVN